MFVPSLSWQNVRFCIYKWLKMPFFAGYYRQMWETQMGEETKSLALGTANADEILDRLALFDAEIQELEQERQRWERRKGLLLAKADKAKAKAKA